MNGQVRRLIPNVFENPLLSEKDSDVPISVHQCE